MKKNIFKGIVNGITFIRIIGTILMPILYNFLSPATFLVVIGVILLTDAADGFLARTWNVSTIFGSLLDMTADKLFAFSILIILSSMYPVMIIPLILECLIASVNIRNVLHGSIGKSSYVGKVKTWVMGISMMSLLLIGLSPELAHELSNINLISELKEKIGGIGQVLISKKDEIIKFFEVTPIIAESVTIADYAINGKNKQEQSTEDRRVLIREQIKELKNDKEFIKRLFDEEYYKKTIDMPLIKKLVPNYYKDIDKK